MISRPGVASPVSPASEDEELRPTQREVKVLFPGVLLRHQILRSGKSARYHLEALRPDTSYEVRISYPAVMPTDFKLRFITPEVTSAADTELTGTSTHNTVRRRLLNVEKLMFRTDKAGSVPGSGDTVAVEVTAMYAGVSTQRSADTFLVTYNILLEELLGDIPYDAFRLMALGAVCLVLIFACIIPRVLPLLPDLGPPSQTTSKDDPSLEPTTSKNE